MMESITFRCVCSASFALAMESEIFAASIRFRTMSAIRTESAWVSAGFAGFGTTVVFVKDESGGLVAGAGAGRGATGDGGVVLRD